jgi:hypothetical protein
MKIIFGTIIIMGLVISNTTFAQDTTNERLVDKYYPKSQQAQPVPETEKVNPVSTTTKQPATINSPVRSVPINATVVQPTPLTSDLNKEVEPVIQTASQVQPAQSPINNEAGKINKSTKIGTDNYNPNPASPIYRDTRLGSSSPLYDTYKKNDNGAGAVTTNPNKG